MRNIKITVMIAEDELLVRLGLKTSIDWEKNGFSLIGECENGIDTLNKLRQYRPNILLLDVKMPGLTGLDVLEYIQKEEMDTKVIVITGLDDFDTVRAALKLGALDYIHKPRLGSGELIEVLSKAKKEVMEQRCSQMIAEDQPEIEFLKHLIPDGEAGYSPIRQAELLRDRKYCFLYLSLIGIYGKRKNNSSYDVHKTFRYAENLITEFCAQKENVWNITIKDNRILVLLTEDRYRTDDVLEKKAVSISHSMNTVLKRFIDVGIRAGISPVTMDAAEAAALCGKAHEAWESTFFLDERIMAFGQIPRADQEAAEQNQVLIKELQLNDSLARLNIHVNHFCEWCDLLQRYFMINQRQLMYHIQSFLYKILMQDILLCEKWLDEFNSCESIRELKEAYRKQLGEYMAGHRRYSHTVEMIIRFIEDNYQRQISLSILSKHCNLNEHYISRVFKEETGENYLAYLNKVRINEAKKLLGDTNLKIYEIAEATGFSSHVNFNYVFNRIEGISPSAYRDKIVYEEK